MIYSLSEVFGFICAGHLRTVVCSLGLPVDKVTVVDGPDPSDEDDGKDPHDEHNNQTVLDGIVGLGEDTSDKGTATNSKDVEDEADETHGGFELMDGVLVKFLNCVHGVLCFNLIDYKMFSVAKIKIRPVYLLAVISAI